jgi:hypothetical protein
MIGKVIRRKLELILKKEKRRHIFCSKEPSDYESLHDRKGFEIHNDFRKKCDMPHGLLAIASYLDSKGIESKNII